MSPEVLRVPASNQSLHLLAGYVAELAAAAELSSRDAYRLRLALDELFTNIVAYASTDPTDDHVQLIGSTRYGQVVVQIIDTGPEFDTVHHEAPQTQLSLMDRPLGGHGLALAHDSADDLRYERVDGENRTTVVVCRTGPPSPARDGSRP